MLQSIRQGTRNIFLFFNNCHRGQAARSAQAMRKIIDRSGLNVGFPKLDRGATGVPNGLWQEAGYRCNNKPGIGGNIA